MQADKDRKKRKGRERNNEGERVMKSYGGKYFKGEDKK